MKAMSNCKNSPAFYEKGGGMSNTGTATIVAGPGFKRICPSHLFVKGDLACNRHARFVAVKGLNIISLSRWRERYEVLVYKYDGDLEIIARAEGDEKEILDALVGRLGVEAIPAILAGIAKSRHYHCREPYFVNEKPGIPRCRAWNALDEIALPPPP